MTSSVSVSRLSSESSWSTKCEGDPIGCRISPSVVSASRSSPPITPCKACNRLVIRGDRFGDIGDLNLGVDSMGSDEFPSGLSVGTEEGTQMEEFGTLILTSWRNEQESENRHLPCE